MTQILNRKIWRSAHGETELLSADTRIRVHLYEATPAQLGDLAFAIVNCLVNTYHTPGHPLADECRQSLDTLEHALLVELKRCQPQGPEKGGPR
jgi:hypothetical protein